MHRFFNHATAAKGLVLATLTCTAMLALWAPSSLTAMAADPSGAIGDFIAYLGLALCVVGWSDVLWTDLLGKQILPRMNAKRRHKLCVLLYSAMGALYAIFAFVALDWRVNTSWILILDYVLVAIFTGGLSVAIAMEKRDKP
jgi:hypothetical protein